MFVDLNKWFATFEREAKQNGNELEMRLAAVGREGWRYRAAADGENAIRAFEEGIKIAKMLKKPCWEMFYQDWVVEIRFNIQLDYQKTLDSLIRLVNELRKAAYENCPIKASVFYKLACIYYDIDFFAYETEIHALFDYIRNETTMDRDTYFMMLSILAKIEFKYERYELARDKAQELFNQVDDNFRRYDCFSLLEKIAFAQGDIPAAMEANRVAQKYAEATKMQDSIAEQKLWKAVYEKYSGNEQAAQQAFQIGLSHYEQYKLPTEISYFEASVEYLELDKQLDAALKMAESVLAIVKAKPCISQQIDAYCAYIALLGRNSRDFSVPLAEVKAIAQTSLKPEPYLQRIARLEAGNYFDFEWQKTSRKNR